MMQRILCDDTYCIIKLLNLTSHFDQFRTGCLQMLRNDIFYCDITMCCGCRKHKCTCLNLIRNDRIFRLVQFLNTGNTDHVSSGSADIGSHPVQEICHINDMRLFRCILDDRLSLCHSCCHHDIDGGSYGNLIHINMGTTKAVCLRCYQTMVNVNLRTHGTESFQMQVDRTASDRTSARQCYFCIFIFSK